MATFKGLIRNCVVCGNEYRSPQSQARVLTCSRECGYKHRVVANKASVELQCKHCSKTFECPPSHVERRIFCSRDCMHKNSEFKECKSKQRIGILNPAWTGLGVAAVSASGKSYTRLQPHIENEKSIRRKRAKDLATPIWADIAKIQKIYAACQAVSKLTGVVHHVDHIVPLTSQLVCGLHCEANLRVIPAVDNLKKHNRRWPDMP